MGRWEFQHIDLKANIVLNGLLQNLFFFSWFMGNMSCLTFSSPKMAAFCWNSFFHWKTQKALRYLKGTSVVFGLHISRIQWPLCQVFSLKYHLLHENLHKKHIDDHLEHSRHPTKLGVFSSVKVSQSLKALFPRGGGRSREFSSVDLLGKIVPITTCCKYVISVTWGNSFRFSQQINSSLFRKFCFKSEKTKPPNPKTNPPP